MICHLSISRTQRCDDRDVHVVAVGGGVQRSVRYDVRVGAVDHCGGWFFEFFVAAGGGENNWESLKRD
jgi:hypothetical protein